MPLQLVQKSPDSLNEFLASVERRAYRQALLTTRIPADALDIVQDAMLQLVLSYRQKPAAEWSLLFQRILQNKVLDWHRQQRRQKRWFWQAPSAIDPEVEDEEPLEPVDERNTNPAALLAATQDIERVLAALEQLPLRQRQAFLLRAWEGFDVEATAAVMGCSDGSVKTHFFRAMQSLRGSLETDL